MEVAAAITGKAAKVTVVGSGKVPFERVLGQQIGARIKRIFEAKGVEFVMGVDVKEFQSSEDTGSLGSVILKNGCALEAQIAILGIGVEPETGFLTQSGLNLNERGYVIVNKVGSYFYMTCPLYECMPLLFFIHSPDLCNSIYVS